MITKPSSTTSGHEEQMEDSQMNPEGLRGLLESRPFRPFAIHPSDGRELMVNHPEFLATSPAGDVAIVFRPEGGFNIVDVELVTGLEVKSRARPADSAED